MSHVVTARLVVIIGGKVDAAAGAPFAGWALVAHYVVEERKSESFFEASQATEGDVIGLNAVSGMNVRAIDEKW